MGRSSRKLKELISVITQKEENHSQAESSEPACCETLPGHESLAAI